MKYFSKMNQYKFCLRAGFEHVNGICKQIPRQISFQVKIQADNLLKNPNKSVEL